MCSEIICACSTEELCLLLVGVSWCVCTFFLLTDLNTASLGVKRSPGEWRLLRDPDLVTKSPVFSVCSLGDFKTFREPDLGIKSPVFSE